MTTDVLDLTLEAEVPGLQGVTFADLMPSFCELEDERKELYSLLQSALQLEHATIPAYLTTLYSLKPDTNWKVIEVLRSVVVEEMLHMVLVANVLNAIGGKPDTSSPGFLVNYPSPLPYGIDGIEVSLLGFSREAI